MTFNKNQTDFPSVKHHQIWWWAVNLIPIEISLIDDVKELGGSELIESCIQMRTFFYDLCSDMYANLDCYPVLHIHEYRRFFEDMSGNLPLVNDKLIWQIEDYSKHKHVKDTNHYKSQDITFDDFIKSLNRLSLFVENKGDIVEIYCTKYPKIFYAMKAFSESPNVKNTLVRYHFAHCEFRQLFHFFRRGYNEVLFAVNDNIRYIADTLNTFAKENKFKREITDLGMIKYKYKNHNVFQFGLVGIDSYNFEWGVFRDWGMRIDTERIFLKLLEQENQELIDFYTKGVKQCTGCIPSCKFEKKVVDFNGRKLVPCFNARLLTEPAIENLVHFQHLVLVRKIAIEKYANA